MGNYYKEFVPDNLDEVFGHDITVKSLRNRFADKSIPNVIIFTGESGTGKTVFSRIVAKAVTCIEPLVDGQPCNKCNNCLDVIKENYNYAVTLHNSSNIKIDDVRRIESNLQMVNYYSPNVVHIFNEFQGLSKNSDAMEAMLMMLERDLPNVYFILTTMDASSLPERLKKAIKNRGTLFHLKSIAPDALLKLVTAVYTQKSKVPLDQHSLKLLSAIVYNAEGSARTALSMLETLISSGIQTEDELLTELNIVSENKINSALSSLLTGNTRLFFSQISDPNSEVYYKLRASLTTLYQVQLGMELDSQKSYLKLYLDKISLDKLNQLLQILNSIKAYPSPMDYIYVFSQCLHLMRPKERKEI